MKQLIILLLSCFTLVMNAQQLNKRERMDGEKEALDVINRFTGGEIKVKVKLNRAKENGHGVYTFRNKRNTLYIESSDAVTACRAFYDFMKSKNAGICSWSGNHFIMPEDIHTEKVEKTSPYIDHQYMNVVTYGYTAAYWDEARWDKEIDWMALHGIDMPLLLVAQEQVYREVFLDMGLSSKEIDEWEVGPAHLPWMRMGNLSGNTFDGPLGSDWNNRQVKLCKHIIDRMRRLGMKPICPAFGGFVPRAFVDYYDVKIDYTGWDWIPMDTRNYRLDPRSEAFAEVGTRFIKKWEEKFGKCTYYLSDSFNEMEIPKDHQLMTSYGDAIYKSITDANPDAVWVMQGWTVGFQRDSWGNGIFQALVKNIPADRFYLLDMATDYNRTWWHSSYNWDFYDGFDGKQWLWSVIPNMGGKTALTGVIDYYANGRLDALNSQKRGKLTGYGIAAEGVENNEILYELITDAGWTTDSIDIDLWLGNYARCRYGEYTETDSLYYKALRTSLYNGFCDHPQFAWQVRNNIIGRGSVQVNDSFYDGVEKLCSDVSCLLQRKARLTEVEWQLYQADLIEATAMYVGGKIEQINSNIRRACEANDKPLANALLKELEGAMLRLDRLLTAHPLYNLEIWEQQAMKMASDNNGRKRNAINARRIVSVWYGKHEKDEPVNDYACRMWAGLIRDYYLPRLVGTWKKKINGEPFDQIAFENSFVEKAPILSFQERLSDDEVVGYLVQLIADVNRLAGDAENDGGDKHMQDWREMFFGK